VHTPGVAADLSHIDTKSKVVGYNGPENLEKALQGELVINGYLFFKCSRTRILKYFDG